MKKNKIHYHKALAIIRRSRPIVFPNEGFMEQLEIYYAMDFNVTNNKPSHLFDLIQKFTTKALVIKSFLKDQ